MKAMLFFAGLLILGAVAVVVDALHQPTPAPVRRRRIVVDSRALVRVMRRRA